MHKKLRAALGVALFLFSPILQSKNSKESVDSVKELISKSQAMILQGDRPIACQLLINALSKDGAKSKGFLEISKALKKCTEFFILEKAQQSYEVAIANYLSDKNQSIEKFKESLNLEPRNALIIKGLIFALLSQNECVLVKKYDTELKKINPYDDELDKFHFLELICSKNKSEALAIMVKSDPALLSQPFWVVNKQRLLLNEKNELNMELDPQFKDYPEIYYVYWLNEKKAKQRMVFADKYKQVCHNPVSFEVAYHYSDPWVCTHIKEIEEFLAKGERI